MDQEPFGSLPTWSNYFLAFFTSLLVVATMFWFQGKDGIAACILILSGLFLYVNSLFSKGGT